MDPDDMNHAIRLSRKSAIEVLVEEIRRYLAAVDAFRLEGCEPRWR
jgi:hypothetical protein